MSKNRSVVFSPKLVPILILLLYSQPLYPFSVNGDALFAEAAAEAPKEATIAEVLALGSVFFGLGYLEFLPPYCQRQKIVQCDCSFNNNTVCHVTEIKMSLQDLIGYIDPAIGLLPYLQRLDLYGNRLTKDIPESIGNLTNLKILSLFSNQLSETIPESIGNLKNLEELDLAGNQFSGTIPNSLGNLKSLKKLKMVDNQLTGSIPSSLGTLANVQEIDLSYNKLDGSIPTSFGNLQSLTSLFLQHNQLAGSIPESLGSLKNLSSLNLSFNYLNGPITAKLSGLQNLSSMILHNNMLSGSIPEELGKLTKLAHLDVNNNELNGLLPQGLGNLTNLQILRLTSNYFSGSIPPSYSKLSRLQIFAVGGNYLSGRIPDFIADWKNLTYLILLGNNFEGNLAEGIFQLPELYELWVSGLRNPGLTFPKKRIMSGLGNLILRNCSINGTIPPYIAEWPSLNHLDLSFNNLFGEVPQFKSPLLENVFLSRNMLNGTFPSWITGARTRSGDPISADLSLNDFTKIPAVHNENGTVSNSQNSITVEPTRNYTSQKGKDCQKKHRSLSVNCGGEEVKFGKQNYANDTALSYFYLSPQENWAYSLSGEYESAPIATNASAYIKNMSCGVCTPEAQLYVNARAAPVSLTYYAFCLHQGKYDVKLLFAETSFATKEDYSELGKRMFDVYIQGKIVLQDFNIKKEAGGANKEVMRSFPITVTDKEPVTIDFFWTGRGTVYDSLSPIAVQNGPLISAISITPAPKKLSAWVIAAIVLASVLFLLILLAFMWRMGWIGDRELRKTHIKIGEKSFSVKEIIDATKKFSPTMKIGKSGRFGIVYKAELPNLTLAVKKLFPQSKAVAEIGTEVYAKTFKLDHENLVQLLAIYSRKGLHLLIYEYMDKGSLEQALFDPKPSLELSWETRYNICLQIAQGLEYLHARNPPIVHRNIKASNILLDGASKAKISDFGLAKLYEEDNPFIYIEESGTRMYMAPEYATRNAVTVGVDVYSFGVLLLEIVSGIKNDQNLGEHHDISIFLLEKVANIHAMVKNVNVQYKKVKYAELVDKRLLPSNYSKEQVITIIDLAILCTDQMASLRPKISDVVIVLRGEKSVEEVSQNKVKNSSSM